MANWQAEIYKDGAALKAAVEAITTGTTIMVIPLENSQYMLIKNA